MSAAYLASDTSSSSDDEDAMEATRHRQRQRQSASSFTAVRLILASLIMLTLTSAAIVLLSNDAREEPVYDPCFRIPRRVTDGATNFDFLSTLYNPTLMFRMAPEELVPLADALLPGIARQTPQRDSYNNVEGLAIVLRLGITRNMIQRAQYNGHKRHHGFKFQDIIAPNGLIIGCFGPVDGRHADPYMLVVSGVIAALPLMQDVTGIPSMLRVV